VLRALAGTPVSRGDRHRRAPLRAVTPQKYSSANYLNSQRRRRCDAYEPVEADSILHALLHWKRIHVSYMYLNVLHLFYT